MSAALLSAAPTSTIEPQANNTEVSLSDRELRKLQNTIYKQYFRVIKGYYVNETRNYRLSEELAHEALFKVLKGLSTFQPERNMANWVHGIARNNLFDYFRSIKTHKNSVNRNTNYVQEYTDSQNYSDVNESENSFTMQQLNDILDQFNETDNFIFRQHIFETASYDKISSETGLTVETIKNKLAYMRKKVRTLMTTEEDE